MALLTGTTPGDMDDAGPRGYLFYLGLWPSDPLTSMSHLFLTGLHGGWHQPRVRGGGPSGV